MSEDKAVSDKEITFELSYVFHTILRKYCDGTGDVVLWNTLFLGSEEDLDTFYRSLWKSLKSGKQISRDTCIEAVLIGEPWYNLMRTGFKLLEDDDYKVLNNMIVEHLNKVFSLGLQESENENNE